MGRLSERSSWLTGGGHMVPPAPCGIVSGWRGVAAAVAADWSTRPIAADVARPASADEQLAALRIDQHVADVAGLHRTRRCARRGAALRQPAARSARWPRPCPERAARPRRCRRSAGQRRGRDPRVDWSSIRRHAQDFAVRAEMDADGGIEDRMAVDDLAEQQMPDAGRAAGVVANELEAGDDQLASGRGVPQALPVRQRPVCLTR